MAFAALAILGHKSAHSFPIGPVIAEPSNIEVQKVKTSVHRQCNDKTENHSL